MAKQHPGMSNREVSKVLGKLWREAPEEERALLIEKGKKEQLKYKDEMAAYRENKQKQKIKREQKREEIAKKMLHHINDNTVDYPYREKSCVHKGHSYLSPVRYEPVHHGVGKYGPPSCAMGALSCGSGLHVQPRLPNGPPTMINGHPYLPQHFMTAPSYGSRQHVRPTLLNGTSTISHGHPYNFRSEVSMHHYAKPWNMWPHANSRPQFNPRTTHTAHNGYGNWPTPADCSSHGFCQSNLTPRHNGF